MTVTIIEYDGTPRQIECESFEFRTNQVENWIRIKYKDGSKEIIHGVATIRAESERVTMTADKYKKVAMDLLAEYLESEQAVISEYSVNFKESAMILKEQVMKYLERLDEGENTFNELVKDMWIANYYKAESEVEE